MTEKQHAAFEREERYLVFKLKDMSNGSAEFLREWAAARQLPNRRYVVVESDWPEYETVWRMIEARVTGDTLAQLSTSPDPDDQSFDANAERLTYEAFGPGSINPEATSIDDLFIDVALEPDLERPEVKQPEIMGFIRYRVEKTGWGFWPYCVRASGGTRELFVGHLKQCERVAARLSAAFEDGKFIAQQHYQRIDASRAAEIERLKVELAMALDASEKGEKARAQCGGMEIEIKELRGAAEHWEAESRTHKQERDAALSRLAEMERQEPVAEVGRRKVFKLHELKFGTKLYARPVTQVVKVLDAKALESALDEVCGKSGNALPVGVPFYTIRLTEIIEAIALAAAPQLEKGE